MMMNGKRGPLPNLVVGVQCPKGHDLYPNGVMPKLLWDAYGIRLEDNQQVVLSLMEREWFFLKKGEAKSVDDQPSHYKNGCYRFTADQFAWTSTKCPVCETTKK